MRNSMIAAFSTAFLVAPVFAAPTTQPVENPPAPAVAQAPTTQPAITEVGTVLVLPFADVSGGRYPWVGSALQQDLLADLSGTTHAKVVAPPSAVPTSDASAAARAGAERGAALVIYGQYQVIANQMLITARIVDTKTGKSGGNFVINGAFNNLFPAEDSLTNELLRALPPGWAAVTLPLANQAAAISESSAATPAVVAPKMLSQQPEYYSYTYPDYIGPPPVNSYYYGDYPYYGYTVPYYGPDLWFYGGWDFYHHHYWHSGWNGWHGHEFEHGVPHGFGHSPAAHGGAGGHGGGGGHR